MSLSYATGSGPDADAARLARARIARINLVRDALALVASAATLGGDARQTDTHMDALEAATRALLLQHRPDLCPRPASKEPTT